jgi:hypothetical protein
MAESILGPRTGGVDFKIATQSYKTLLTEQEFEHNVGQDDVSTFNDEPDSAFEEGETRNAFRFAGILKQGSTAAAPLIPAPQGVVVTQMFGTALNQLVYTANFSRLLIRRTAKQNGIFAGEGVAVGPVVMTWKTT